MIGDHQDLAAEARFAALRIMHPNQRARFDAAAATATGRAGHHELLEAVYTALHWVPTAANRWIPSDTASCPGQPDREECDGCLRLKAWLQRAAHAVVAAEAGPATGRHTQTAPPQDGGPCQQRKPIE